jgi:hypothetical protein
MGKLKRLVDAYRFPGFRPHTRVKGKFGDPYALIVTLDRRQKKRHAGAVAPCTASFMTARSDWFGTWAAVTAESTWRQKSAGLTVRGATA